MSDGTQPLDILSADSECVCYSLSTKRVPGQPNPWNKSCTANSCYGNWVYSQDEEEQGTDSLRNKTLDFREFDSSRILMLRGGIIMSIGIFRELVSQEVLVGIILVGKLGVLFSPSPAAGLRAAQICLCTQKRSTSASDVMYTVRARAPGRATRQNYSRVRNH